jgi:hypothetical protein
MINSMEQQIRERAYELWMLNGRVEGRAAEHWLEAERQLLARVAPAPTPARTTEVPAQRAVAKRRGRAAKVRTPTRVQ